MKVMAVDGMVETLGRAGRNRQSILTYKSCADYSYTLIKVGIRHLIKFVRELAKHKMIQSTNAFFISI